MITPVLPVPNIPLLRKAVEFAEASAQLHGPHGADEKFDEIGLGTLWDQGDWSHIINAEVAISAVVSGATVDLEACGTVYCVAGFVCAQDPGYQAEVRLSQDGYPYLMETINGEPFNHSQLAQKALGLTYAQAEELFDGANTVQMVREIAERIAGEKL